MHCQIHYFCESSSRPLIQWEPNEKCDLVRGTSRGAIGAIASLLKPTKVTFFTMIFYNSENSIRDMKHFCRPLFCHSSVLKYTSSLLQ